MLIYCNKMNWEDEKKQKSGVLYYIHGTFSILQQHLAVIKEVCNVIVCICGKYESEWKGKGGEFKYQSKIYKLSCFMNEKQLDSMW